MVEEERKKRKGKIIKKNRRTRRIYRENKQTNRIWAKEMRRRSADERK